MADEKKKKGGEKRKAAPAPISKKQRREAKRRRGKVADVSAEEVAVDATKVVCHRGLRCILPYEFTFATFVKGRWLGRTLRDVMKTEFPYRPDAYYDAAIRCGVIQVDGQTVDAGHVLAQSQVITHKTHRHEPPVIDGKISLIGSADGGDLLALDKPPSMPVHVSGRFNRNTVIDMAAMDPELGVLHPIHRLDRLVSGVLVVGRTGAAAERARKLIADHVSVRKVYLARVDGVFPEGETVCKGHVRCKDPRGGVYEAVAEPTSDSKTAETVFRRVSTDGKTSVVECEPRTGRTHQLRVHLNYLGHPIVNDVPYGGRLVTSHLGTKPYDGLGRRGAVQVAAKDGGDGVEGKDGAEDKDGKAGQDAADADVVPDDDAPQMPPPWVPAGAVTPEDREALTCGDCLDPARHMAAISQRGMEIWLCAVSYSCEAWKFELPRRPAWAADDFSAPDGGVPDQTRVAHNA